MISIENEMEKSNKSDINWRFSKYLGISHVLMWFYGGALVTLYFQVPPVGIARTVNSIISLMFILTNMVGIIGIIGKPIHITEEESYISWRSFGIAAIFFLSVSLFIWVAASMDLNHITIWSRK
jgi:hypothetical protein